MMKIKAYYLYLLLVIWTIFLTILLKITHLNVTGLGIILVFLTVIFIPGILLWRISSLKMENLAVKLLYIIGLGFGYYFLFNFLAIIFGLTLSQLSYISTLILIVIFIIALWKDRNSVWQGSWEWFKKQEISDYILSAFLIIGSLVALSALSAQSDKLIGDGYFHLAILQKIVSGNSLKPLNLWVTKTDVLNPVYSFPIWHILVGEFSKLLDISIFTALKQILLPVGILSLIVWYGFMTVVLKNKYLVALAFLSFLLIFLRDNTFYYLVALTSPDSFNRLFFLPLILGITISYLFESQGKIISIVFISLLAVFLGLIHFTQFIYLVLILICLLLLFLLIREKDKSLRLLCLLGGMGILILPYLLIQFRLIWDFLKSNAAVFQGDKIVFNTYLGTNVVYRYAILTLPLLVLFVKKQSRLIVLVAIMLCALLIYWPYFGLRIFFLKYLSAIFVERSLANIPHFIFFGFLLFLFIYGLNYLFNRFAGKFIWFINLILLLLLLALPFLEEPIIQLVDGYLLNESKIFYGFSFWFVLILVALTALIIWIYRRNLNLPVVKNKLNFVILTVLLITMFALPYLGNLEKVWAANPNGTILTNRSADYASDVDSIGGKDLIDFFQSQSRAVFLTDNVSLSQTILLYSDNLAAEYPYGVKEFTQSLKFYDQSSSDSVRLALLDYLKVDFVILRHEDELAFFNDKSTNFQKVFEKKIRLQRQG